MKNGPLDTIKTSGFRIPEFYFESIEENIVSKLKKDDILKSGLSSGFEIPEGYFDVLEADVLLAVNKEKRPKVINLFNWRHTAYITGIAASLLIAFSLIFSKKDSVSFDNLETASIENYLLNEDLTAYDIAPYVKLNELDAADFVETAINTSDIEDYLLQNSDVEHLISD